MHKRFQELSALAVTGQITREERALLEGHLRHCAECRAFVDELTLMKTHVAPVVAAHCASPSEPPAGIRERFIARAAAAGLAIDAGPVLAPQPSALPRPVRPTLRRWTVPLLQYGIPAAACVLCAFLGYYIAEQRPAALAPPIVAHLPLPVPLPSFAPPVASPPAATHSTDSAAQFASERAESQRRLDALTAALAQARADNQALTQEVASASRFEVDLKAEAQRVQNAEDRVRQLQRELKTEQDRRLRLELAAVPMPSTQQSKERIAELEAQLTRERDAKSARGEFADLIAARNLHIVDVYDTAANGRRDRPFGRVFYVEGRSLVFYAYDLPGDLRPNAQIAFHVWGEKASVKSTTYNLGILSGDGGPRRWVLTFDDPKVLNSINAVYVTTEVAGDAGRQPRGRRILYAFLGTPNHP